MTTSPPPGDIRRALWENASAPNGLLRNARAEELVAAAESTGNRDLLRQALFGLIKAYEYSTERGKMMVPFARLLQEWDQDPSAFDSSDTYTFHWLFKWVSSGMLSLPEMPLASMEKWLAEMERRYRVGGYSERAVRQAEFELADDTGDTERAARAFAAWTAADRDQMANCHACELNDQGWYWLRQGQDEKALQVWEPVLAGRSTCMEEPHRVLAKSLLPLLRTGRADEARRNHLRGYRMARGNESLLPSIGLHIEFCALTGNEGRGLELLAEHASHLTSQGNPSARLEMFTGTLVLLQRLLALGLQTQPAVAYAGQQRTVRELYDILDSEAVSIAARFDLRNGSDVVSRRLAGRRGARPLVDSLPLGVRAASLTAAVPSAAVAPAPQEAASQQPLSELVAEARQLRTQGHPKASSAWDRVDALVAERDEAPDPMLAADLLERRAVRAGHAGGDTVRSFFEQTVAAYRAAGDPGRAALNELRVVYAAAQTGAEPDEIRKLLATATASAQALDPSDPTRTRRIATAALSALKLEPALRDTDGGELVLDHTRFDSDLAAFVAEFAGAVTQEGGEIGDLLSDAEQLRAEQAWHTGDVERADELFASAAGRSITAGRPWDAAESLSRRARLLLMLQRPQEAEQVARAALTHGAELVEPDELGRIRLTLAEILYQHDGKESEAALYALEATHWFDAAGDSAGAGAYARLVLAQAYGETGRAAEAAEVLESVLPDLLEHGDERAVQARETLARNLRALGDQRAAAEQYLLAAEVVKGWEHQRPHAQLATLAAECLAGAGMQDEAVAAYHRAVDLWETVGEAVALARALRSLAWLEAQEGDSRAAKDLMEKALSAVGGDGPELLLERARTWTQTAELLLDDLYEYDEDDDGEDEGGSQDGGEAAAVRREALVLLDRADAAFEALGAEVLDERARCVVRAAWTERELDRTDDATARVRALIGELSALPSDGARSAVRRLEHTLGQLTPPS
ncbi:tetratricopeptide repeat protein [Streptomyces sp. NBC_00390]|uniref:tetratricopeptide repeat protein n=1 Tax=Streptomyces sp. NBC_00390 TaxID=2975736 RepID=UPI002E1E45AC